MPTRLLQLVLLIVALVATCVWTPVAAAADGKVTLTKKQAKKRASYRYVHMTNEQAFAELDKRGVKYKKLKAPYFGVRAPMRLTGKLHGVHVHSSLPEDKRKDSAFEVLDARLALALDDFCALLERHDIVELVHYTMYRPNGLKPGTEHKHATKKATKKPRKKTRSGTKTKAKRTSKKTKTKPKKRAKKKAKTRRTKRNSKKAKPKPRKRAKKKPAPKKTAKTKKKKRAKKTKTKKRAKKTKTKKRAKKTARKPRKKKGKASKPKATKKRAKKTSNKKRKRGKAAKPKPPKKIAYSPPGTRHPAGLAIDVGALRKRDGRWIGVAQHFKGKIGATTCGAAAKPHKSAASRELWSIACEAVDLGIFTYVLTPNYDAAHHDHFHMEIRPDVLWYWVK